MDALGEVGYIEELASRNAAAIEADAQELQVVEKPDPAVPAFVPDVPETDRSIQKTVLRIFERYIRRPLVSCLGSLRQRGVRKHATPELQVVEKGLK